MAKAKFDTKKLQQFVLEKGERVGLAAAAAVMVLLVGYGVWCALRARSPEGDIKKATDDLANRIANARPSEKDKQDADPKNVKPIGDWYKLNRFDVYTSAGPWYDPGAAGDSKRRNPNVLPPGEIVAGKVTNINVNYLEGGVPCYAYNPKSETLATLKPGVGGGGLPNAPPPAPAASAGEDNFAREVRPTRMVVINATFPYAEQLEVCRKALRMASVKDLFAAQADPVFLGMVVYRWEVLPDGKTTEPKALYDYDPAKDRNVVLMPETERLLATAVYDEASKTQIADYAFIGLVTPLPRLYHAQYPPLGLTGIVVKDAEVTDKAAPPAPPATGRPPLFPTGGPQFPGMKGPGFNGPGTGAATDNGPMMVDGPRMSIAKLPDTLKQLQQQLMGNIEIFDPAGMPLDTGVEDKSTTPAPPRPPQYMSIRARRAMGPKGAAPDPAATDKIPDKILVRFFDADVVPGKTYQYSLQVRMANPNYGKKAEVAYLGLAEIKELVSPFTTTPTVTIPNEFFVYAVDTNPKQLASQAVGPKGTEKEPTGADKTAIQVHRWVGVAKTREGEHVVADWLIAERLLVHRGEKLGRERVLVELPAWNKLRAPNGQFELLVSGGNTRGPLGKAFRHASPVDFLPSDRPASILVDFEGGKRPYLTLKGSINDEASTELLVLNPDGKLVVQTSRDDSDPDTPAGKERKDRYDHWQNELNRYRGGSGAKMPGVGGAGG